MKKFLSILIVFLLGSSILDAQPTNTLKLVTPQMSQKMYRTIKAYPNIALLMYHLLGATSTLDAELKIEAIAEHPDNAKNALIKLCAFLDNQGGEDYLDANLLQVFHFTARETQLAKSIYLDYRDEQITLKEQLELQKEEDLIRRWETYGKEVFDFGSDNPKLLRPRIDLDIKNALVYIDSITANSTNSSSNPIAIINFVISDKGKIEDFSASGIFGNVFSESNFHPAVPAHYYFEYLDTTTVFVPCKVNIPITEEWDKIKELEIEIKYDKKKKSWKISSYDPSKEISSDDLQFINRFLESLPNDDPLREKKQSLRIGLGKHWIKFNNKKLSLTFPLTRQCRIEKPLNNKSSIQRFGEKHLNW